MRPTYDVKLEELSERIKQGSVNKMKQEDKYFGNFQHYLMPSSEFLHNQIFWQSVDFYFLTEPDQVLSLSLFTVPNYYTLLDVPFRNVRKNAVVVDNAN